MENLEIKVQQSVGTITTNFDDIEKNLKMLLSNYQGIVVTDDTVKESKKDIAELRKIKTSIDDEKKRIKKIWNVPYVEFETKCKNLMALVDEPINEINKQVAEFEQKAIDQKKLDFMELYSENIEDLSDFIPFEVTLEDKWTNVSYKGKDYLYALSERKTHIKSDLDVIRSLNSEIEDECITAYKRNGNNLSAAVSRNQQYIDDKNRVKNQVKEEVREEIKSEVKEDTPMTHFNDFSEMIKMHHFIVSESDAEKVRNLLTFSEIPFREE